MAQEYIILHFTVDSDFGYPSVFVFPALQEKIRGQERFIDFHWFLGLIAGSSHRAAGVKLYFPRQHFLYHVTLVMS